MSEGYYQGGRKQLFLDVQHLVKHTTDPRNPKPAQEEDKDQRSSGETRKNEDQPFDESARGLPTNFGLVETQTVEVSFVVLEMASCCVS